MMNLSAIMGRIAGKGGDSGAPAGVSVPGETGIATGGSFAALVQFATQAGPRAVQGELGLVVDKAGLSSAAAPAAATALMGEADAAPSVPATTLPTGGEAALWTQFAANPGRAPQADANALAAADSMVPAGPVTPLGDAESAESTQAVPGEGDAPTSADGAAQAQTQTQAQTQIFGIPTSAAAMAAMAPWSGEQVVAETAPSSLPEEGASPALGIASTAPIATLAQAAAAPEARGAKGGARFVAQPTIVTPTPPGAANPESQTGDAADTGTAGGRTSEQTATTIGATPATGLSATGTGVPLRMIVDSLPPGIQSTLSAGAIATVSGPSTGEQLGDQVIDMGVSGQWIDRMAREITALAEGSGHSRFTLNPPHLGRLQVDLWQGQDATSVRLVAETDEAARRLGEGRSALQADARMAALNLGSITIEKAAQSHDSARDSGNHRTGAESQGQMQQQAAGQGQGNGQGQARSGSNQPQGEWVGRAFRHDQDQQGDASPSAAACRAASDHVRFA